jgi:Protein of unknown function (DUF1761)
MTLDINWLAVLVAAVVTFVLGGIWYGPMFGKVWRAAEGRPDPDQCRPSILPWSTVCRLC